MNRRAFGLIAAALLLVSPDLSHAEDFYKGKTLTIAVGGTVGAIYDLWARLFGRYVGGFIPGSPTVLVQNMPGAAGTRAANYLYNAAPKDGTFIALSLDNILLNSFLSPADVKFQADRFQWIGRSDRATRMLYAWTATGIRDVEDARKREVLTGITAPGTSTQMYPSLANSVLKTRFKLVSGYDGAGGLHLALERGELEAVGAASIADLAATKPEWLREKKIRGLFQTALERSTDLPDTPTLLELCKTDEERAIVRLLANAEDVGFFLIAPPEIPEDRVAILREAFTRMSADPAYLAEARRLDPAGPHYMSGADMQKLAATVAATPADIVAKFKQDIAVLP